MQTHETIAGTEIAYDDTVDGIATFLDRMRQITDDPRVTVSQFVDIAFGPDNPILKEGPVPGRGWIDAEVLANPVYAVLLDLQHRKTVQQVNARPVPPPLSVSQVAALKGVSTDAIRQAIRGGRLPAAKDGRSWRVARADAQLFEVQARGVAAPLEVRFGGEAMAALKFASDGDLEIRAKNDGVRVGTLAGWKSAVVLTVDKTTHTETFYELAPASSVSEVAVGSLHVQGRFSVVQEVSGDEARRMWTSRRGDYSRG